VDQEIIGEALRDKSCGMEDSKSLGENLRGQVQSLSRFSGQNHVLSRAVIRLHRGS